MRRSVHISLLLLTLSSMTALGQRYTHTVGQKRFEVANHLGNVMVVSSDRKLTRQGSTSGTASTYDSDMVDFSDYYPYGMWMTGRSNSNDYRFGFQGQEQDANLKGEGHIIHFAYRIYDPRLGRWLSPDPVAGEFPQSSSYLLTHNSPLFQIDPDGRKAKVSIKRNEEGGGTIEITTTVYVAGLEEDVASQFIAMMNQEAKELLKDGAYTDDSGNTWTIKLSINYEAGEKGNDQEDQFFNNQLTISDTENMSSAYTGEGKVTGNTVKKALKGNRDKVGTVLEESIHFLGLGDQYDIVVEGVEEKQVGFLPKTGFEDDVLTGGTRKANFGFSDQHFESFGQYFQKQGLLLPDNTTETSLINTRISGGIEKVRLSDLKPEQRKNIVRSF